MQLESEVKELTKHRNLAHAKLGDALCEIQNGHFSHQCKRKNGDPYHPSDDSEELSGGTSSSVSTRRRFLKSNLYQGLEESAPESDKDSNTICRDVCCAVMNEASKDGTTDPLSQTAGQDNVQVSALAVSGNGESEDEEIMSSSPVEPSPWSLGLEMSNSGCLRSSRCSICSPSLMTGSSSPSLKILEPNEKTPPNQSTMIFTRRSPHSRRRIPPLNYNEETARLSRNNTRSSVGSAQLDELNGQNRVSKEEGIPSIDTFVAGMKEMAKLQYEKDAADIQVKYIFFFGVQNSSRFSSYM